MSTKRVIRNLALIIAGFVLLLVILAEVFKETAVKIVLEKGAASFSVPLSVGDVDLTLLRKFPLATIEFNDLRVVDSVNQSLPDTILDIKKLYASVDIRELIDGNILVKKVEVVGARANYKVDTAGVSNLDFVFDAMSYDSTKVEEPDTTKLQGIYALDNLLLEDIQLNYSDSKLQFASTLELPEVNVKGKLQPEGYFAAIEGEAVLVNLAYDDFRLDPLSNSKLLFEMSALNDTVTINDLVLKSSSLDFELKGQLTQQQWPELDVAFKGDISSLKGLVTLLPKKYLEQYKVHQLDGDIVLNGTVKGMLTDSLLPRIDASYQVQDFNVKYDTYPLVRNVQLKGTYTNGEKASDETTLVTIEALQADCQNSSVQMKGELSNLAHINYNFQLGANVELANWISFVPDNMVEQMKGRVSAQVSTSGILPDSITDAFTEYAIRRTSLNINANDVTFVMDSVPEVHHLYGNVTFRNGSIKANKLKVLVPEYHVNLTDAALTTHYQGSVLDYENLRLVVDTFLLQLNHSSELKGSAQLASLNKGDYQLSASANLNLADLQQMIPDSMQMSMSGKVNAAFQSAGKLNLDSIENQLMDLLMDKSIFSLQTQDLTVLMPDTLACINNLTADVSYLNDSISIQKTSGVYNAIDFDVDSASITNIYNGYLKNEKKEITVKGNFYFGDVDYAFFLPFIEEDTTAVEAPVSETETIEPQNWSYRFQGKVGAKSFRYGKALFENINTKVLAIPDYYVADQFKVTAFGGDMLASFKYEVGGEEHSVAQYKMDLKGMDIHQLLKDFNDFSDFYDPEITSEQVQGVFSTHMDGRIVLGKDYEVNYDSIIVKGDLLLEQGALINVQPIMDIEDIPMIGIKGLDNLRFSTLDSKIFIYNNKWYVPSTEIRTTSFDANFFGMSSFAEEYSYHIRMFLGEVLSSKSKKNLAKQAKEDGFEEETSNTKGRTSLYLVSRMIDGKSKAWFDKMKDRQHMRKTIKAQQGALNFIFFPKLVNFETGVE